MSVCSKDGSLHSGQGYDTGRVEVGVWIRVRVRVRVSVSGEGLRVKG